jgi:uncharacterized pyridoxal phosphate-containing UPF0001 family protein
MIIVAVSKGQTLEKIQKAITLGQTVFGENYLQEALPKILALKNQNLQWHFIGKIQSNKTRDIATHFSWIQSLDDLQIAERLILNALQISLHFKYALKLITPINTKNPAFPYLIYLHL